MCMSLRARKIISGVQNANKKFLDSHCSIAVLGGAQVQEVMRHIHQFKAPDGKSAALTIIIEN